jgi:hypothetical protein
MSSLLHYRPWQGSFHAPWRAVWPIARVALATLLRRRLFWVLYALSLFVFLMFFFGNFLLGWVEAQLADRPLQIGNFAVPSERINAFIRDKLRVLSGARETFTVFFGYQGTMTLVILALSGAVLVGNDLQHRSLPFYLAKPIARRHYLLGKSLAVAVVVHLLMTAPALLLYAQHAFEDLGYLTNVDFFRRGTAPGVDPGPAGWRLLLGVVGYGMVFSVCLALLLVTCALWQRTTAALIVLWVAIFVFSKRVAGILVDDLKWDPLWRLLDLWNTMGLLGQWCLGYTHPDLRPAAQPEYWQAAAFLVGVGTACMIYLYRRTRSLEIVR